MKTVAKILILIICMVLMVESVTASAAQQPTSDFTAIDVYVQEQMDKVGIPGVALGIIQNGQAAHLKGFGEADSSGRAVTPQTPFRIGSLTKAFTALAVMQLVEDGKIELDEPVQTYLPWFRAADEEASAMITVRHLLNQTSGFSIKDGNSFWASEAGLEETVRSLDKINLTQPVGTTYQYCNINYMIAGLIIETVSGQTYGEYVSSHIFAPLDMQHSHSSLESAEADGIAQGHLVMFGLAWEDNGPIPPANLPAGTLIASIENLTHYATAQLNGGRYAENKILSQEGMDELHTAAVQIDENTSYAMGWTVAQRNEKLLVFHTGDDGRFHSVLILQPEQNMGLILLANGTGFIQSEEIDQIAVGVLNILNDQPAQPIAASFLVAFSYWISLLTPVLMILGILFILRNLKRLNLWWMLVIVIVYLGLILMLFQLALRIITLSSMLVFYPELGYSLIATAVIGISWSVIILAAKIRRQKAQ